MWCFAVSVGAVHNDSTVSVVSFDIAGTLKQNFGVTLPASAAPPPIGDLTSRESLEAKAADIVGTASAAPPPIGDLTSRESLEAKAADIVGTSSGPEEANSIRISVCIVNTVIVLYVFSFL